MTSLKSHRYIAESPIEQIANRLRLDEIDFERFSNGNAQEFILFESSAAYCRALEYMVQRATTIKPIIRKIN